MAFDIDIKPDEAKRSMQVIKGNMDDMEQVVKIVLKGMKDLDGLGGLEKTIHAFDDFDKTLSKMNETFEKADKILKKLISQEEEHANALDPSKHGIGV